MALPRIPPGAHGRPGPHRVCGAGVAGQHVPARPSFQFLLKRPGTPGAAPPERGRIDVPTAGRSFLCTSRPSPRVSVAGNLCTPGDPTHVCGLGTPPAPGPGGWAARSGHGRSRAGSTVGQGRLGARSQKLPPLGCVEAATAPRLPREAARGAHLAPGPLAQPASPALPCPFSLQRPESHGDSHPLGARVLGAGHGPRGPAGPGRPSSPSARGPVHTGTGRPRGTLHRVLSHCPFSATPQALETSPCPGRPAGLAHGSPLPVGTGTASAALSHDRSASLVPSHGGTE